MAYILFDLNSKTEIISCELSSLIMYKIYIGNFNKEEKGSIKDMVKMFKYTYSITH